MNANEKHLAVIMATFNRPDVTSCALSALRRCILPPGLTLSLTVVDASSSSDTVKVIYEQYPESHVVSVSSDRYWAQSMRTAWDKAADLVPSFLLWLNDDVVLRPDAIMRLFACLDRQKGGAVVAGATNGGDGGISYTGYKRGPLFRRLSFARLDVSDVDQYCDAINGNVVLAPSDVDRAIGGFPKGYVHGMADFAYSLDARKHNIPVVLAPGTVGVCENNAISGTWRDASLNRLTRWRRLLGPKGLPLRPWLRYCISYGGAMAIPYFLKPYLDVLVGSSRRTSNTSVKER